MTFDRLRRRERRAESDTEAEEWLEFSSEFSAMLQGRLKKLGY